MDEQRINEFTNEVAELKVRGANGDSELLLLWLGSLLLIAGVALGVIGGVTASGAANTADQVAAIATGGLLGLVLVVAGAALYIRFSLGRMLRFWMVRLVHEHRSETDRLIEAITKK